MAIKPTRTSDRGQDECDTPVGSALKPGAEPGAEPGPLPWDVRGCEPSPMEDAHCEPASRPLPALGDLARLLRLEKYESRRGRQVRLQLHQAQMAAARTSRLLCAAPVIQHTLAECIRSEDKQSFANLFSAFRDTLSGCSQPVSLSDQPWPGNDASAGYPESFLDALSSSQQSALLGLLAKTRGDSAFVADRLSSLTHKDLLALLPDRNFAKPGDSVFDTGTRSASRASRHLAYVVDGQTDLLTTLDYHSPLEVLIHPVRPVHVELYRDDITKDVWATTCARLISDQKRGSERVVPAIIEIWAKSSPWPGKQRLENWIARTLESGAFLLEQPSRQSFRVRMQGRQDPNADDEASTEAFFTSSVRSLLILLADMDGASLIPDGAISLCQAISVRLPESSGQREAFANFVLTRWLFNPFVLDAITLPETHGLISDRFVSDNARQRILRDVVIRAQKTVFNAVYSWKLGNTISLDLVDHVTAIANRFRPPPNSQLPTPRSSGHADGQLTAQTSPDQLVAVSMSDVCVLVNALYPQCRPASPVSESNLGRSGLESSASSVSGFSLFPTPNSSNITLAHTSSWSPDAVKLPLAGNDISGSNEQQLTLDQDSFSSPIAEEAYRLRDVCSSMDDLVVSGLFSSHEQLAIICADHVRGSPITQHTKLQRIMRSTNDHSIPPPSLSHASLPTGYHECESAIVELLQDFELDHTATATWLAEDWAVEKWLIDELERRIEQSQRDGDYVLARTYLTKLLNCERLLADRHGDENIRYILVKLEDKANASLARTMGSLAECEGGIRSVRPVLDRMKNSLSERSLVFDRLRDKMWYTADARTSAAYDEVRSIASALKVMGRPRKASKSRTVPPLRHWSGSKVSNNDLHLKTEAQILELLSASSNHGGPNKLSDDQARLLVTWFEQNNVENLCRGEERLHKLCAEINKAVEHMTSESSPLMSSSLFPPERPYSALHSSGSETSWHAPKHNRFDVLRLHTNVLPSRDAGSSIASSHPLSARSSRDYLETRSPTVTTRSSAPFWSPAMTETVSPSSATSIGSSHPQAKYAGGQASASTAYRQDPLAEVRKHATSLLLSELTATMYYNGSETDQAFWTGLGGELAVKSLQSLQRQTAAPKNDLPNFRRRFDYDGAFTTLVDQFSAACAPPKKLDALLELDSLLRMCDLDQRPRFSTSQPTTELENSGSLPPKQKTKHPVCDAQVNGFRRLFSSSRTRPATVFRDLQYIIAFVPSVAVEYSSRSTAFWHAALAISGIKKELCSMMVETADSIIAYHSNNRGHGRTPSTAQQERDSATFPATSQTPPAEDVAKYSMADAGHLLQITAKEGDAVAQRELATLYLTNPELMDHIIAPFARPKEVFKEELESKWRKNQDPTRCDPATMCVAHHWMSLSAKGGDALAKEYLKQREEMEKLP